MPVLVFAADKPWSSFFLAGFFSAVQITLFSLRHGYSLLKDVTYEYLDFQFEITPTRDIIYGPSILNYNQLQY